MRCCKFRLGRRGVWLGVVAVGGTGEIDVVGVRCRSSVPRVGERVFCFGVGGRGSDMLLCAAVPVFEDDVMTLSVLEFSLHLHLISRVAAAVVAMQHLCRHRFDIGHVVCRHGVNCIFAVECVVGIYAQRVCRQTVGYEVVENTGCLLIIVFLVV